MLMAPEDELDGVSLYDIRSSNTFHNGTRSFSFFSAADLTARWRKLIVERVPVSLVEIFRITSRESGVNGKHDSKSSFVAAFTQGM